MKPNRDGGYDIYEATNGIPNLKPSRSVVPNR
jgi:hypothetical protein